MRFARTLGLAKNLALAGAKVLVTPRVCGARIAGGLIAHRWQAYGSTIRDAVVTDALYESALAVRAVCAHRRWVFLKARGGLGTISKRVLRTRSDVVVGEVRKAEHRRVARVGASICHRRTAGSTATCRAAATRRATATTASGRTACTSISTRAIVVAAAVRTTERNDRERQTDHHHQFASHLHLPWVVYRDPICPSDTLPTTRCFRKHSKVAVTIPSRGSTKKESEG